MLTIPLIIAVYILMIAVLFTDVDLIRNGSSLHVALAIAISVAAGLITYFIVIMANYLFELALEAEYERALQK